MATEKMASLRSPSEPQALAFFRLWWQRGGQPIATIEAALGDDAEAFYAAIWETAWAACEAFALAQREDR